MKAIDFISLYRADGYIQTLTEGIRTSPAKAIHIQSLHGSLDAVLLAVVYNSVRTNHVVVLHNKEEAFFFMNDLQNLLGEKRIFLFPMSYKRPYEYEEIENANVLMRAEVLNQLNNHPEWNIIVTYPEALSEKVITKKSLSSNTFLIQKDDPLDSDFLEEYLHTYGFEKTDFVLEAGQFAIRGGIIDIFSFAHEYPYRIELSGNQVDSIRSFNPGSQLSIEPQDKIRLMPNVQTRLIEEERQSIFDFISPTSRIWIKDVALITDVVARCFESAAKNFDQILRESGHTKVVLEPTQLFETPEAIAQQLEKFSRIEFGSRFFYKATQTFELKSSAQPSFNKNFELLASNLLHYQQQQYTNFIAAEQPKQAERLQNIFQEIHPELKFQTLAFSLRQGFSDPTLKIVCYTDHQIFERYHRYKNKERFSKSKALTFRELQTLQPGDFVTHIDYGIAKFVGLEKKEVAGRTQEAIRLIFRDNDLMFVSIHLLHKISKYSGKDGTLPTLSKLGSSEWDTKKEKAKKKVKDIAKELIHLYAKRKSAPGFAYSADSFLQAELESSFLYEDTPDQAKATEEVKYDMQQPHPMDRLVCGDVGFGKTEIAIRAAFKAVTEGKQVALLVPTTILAMQHYRTFSERLANFPVTIQYISRFKTPKEIKDILKKVKDKTIHIIIGTHRLVSKDVVFADLGLLIIDEEQKFGVKVKDRLKELKVNIDVLTLTATPIPRTLHFSLMGARDLSIMATPPPNRQPVTTALHTYNEEIIRDAIRYELQRGGQVFFVHQRISDIEHFANVIFRLVPDSHIGIAHGQMDGDKLEKVMMRFIEGEYNVLVSTNIIESGLDIPNANTILINHANLFGLSDLHQMRGRVGRSNKKSFCYLLTPPTAVLSADSRKRLMALEEFSELGDGFKVAMRDLDIRGVGNLLGGEQSGFITDLGFEAYHQILDEAVQELKETEFKELFAEALSAQAKLIAKDCTIETDLEILIPDTYINSTSERLQMYSSLDNIKNEEALQKFTSSLKDRFGEPPTSVYQLIQSVQLRWVGEALGLEKISLKNEKMRAHFISNKADYFKSAVFGTILSFVQNHPQKCKLKDSSGKLILTIENITSVEQALTLLSPLCNYSSKLPVELTIS